MKNDDGTAACGGGGDHRVDEDEYEDYCENIGSDDDDDVANEGR